MLSPERRPLLKHGHASMITLICQTIPVHNGRQFIPICYREHGRTLVNFHLPDLIVVSCGCNKGKNNISYGSSARQTADRLKEEKKS
jgi:ribosomal protein S19